MPSSPSKPIAPLALARRFWETHGGELSPLLGLRQWIREHGAPSEENLINLARDLSIPVATLRGVASFYESLADNDPTIRVCNGTACHLAGGGKALTEELSVHGKTRLTACPGYCHRAPALLDAKGLPFAGGEHRAGLDQMIKTGKGMSDAVLDFPYPNLLSAAPEVLLLRRFSGEGPEPWSTWTEVEKRAPDEVLESIHHPILNECAATNSPDERYLIAHAIEGQSGNVAHRFLMEADPHAILEGMTIVAHAIGATEGIIYVPYEYPRALAKLTQAIHEAPRTGFEISLFPGAGNEPPGDDSALLNVIEGLRAEPRIQPPRPAQSGLYGAPTAVLDVESFVYIERTAGSKPLDQTRPRLLSVDVAFSTPGLIEVEPEVTVEQLVEYVESPSGSLAAVLIGGQNGRLLPPEEWASHRIGDLPGNFSLTGIPIDADLEALLAHWVDLFAAGACGKCVPCSLGSQRAQQILADQENVHRPLRAVRNAVDLASDTSLCAHGQEAPGPIIELIRMIQSAAE